MTSRREAPGWTGARSKSLHNRDKLNQASRRKPPFHHKVAAALACHSYSGLAFASADGGHVDIVVAAGSTAWQIANELWQRPALCLVSPPGEDPAAFDWSLLKGAAPSMLFSDDGDHTDLAKALIRDGALRVLCVRTGLRWIGEVARHG